MKTDSATPFTGLGRRAYNRESDTYAPAALEVPRFAGPSKTHVLRELIRQHGRLNAGQLATLASLESTGRVGALLKHDITLGRIRFDGACYCWNVGYDERLGDSISDAIALLRRHGYTVKAPA